MHLSSETIKSLCAVTYDGKIINISNKVFRKWSSLKSQSRDGKNNIFIACDYRYREKTLEWGDNMAAFCHPFHEKYARLFPKNKPKFLFSESDMVDEKWLYSKCINKNICYDFVFFTMNSMQGVKCKGYHVLGLLDKAAGILGMKGLVVDFYKFRNKGEKEILGKINKGGTAHNLQLARVNSKNLNYLRYIQKVYTERDLCDLWKKVRFGFFGNTSDCSPRMLSEALLRGTPVLVNNKIFGGWKYITNNNGLLFDGASNSFDLNENKSHYLKSLVEAMKIMKTKVFNREVITSEYMSKYGFLNSSRRLALIINHIEGHNNYKLVAYKELSFLLKKCRNDDYPEDLTI